MAYSPVGQGGALLRTPALARVAARHGATPGAGRHRLVDPHARRHQHPESVGPGACPRQCGGRRRWSCNRTTWPGSTRRSRRRAAANRSRCYDGGRDRPARVGWRDRGAAADGAGRPAAAAARAGARHRRALRHGRPVGRADVAVGRAGAGGPRPAGDRRAGGVVRAGAGHRRAGGLLPANQRRRAEGVLAGGDGRGRVARHPVGDRDDDATGHRALRSQRLGWRPAAEPGGRRGGSDPAGRVAGGGGDRGNRVRRHARLPGGRLARGAGAAGGDGRRGVPVVRAPRLSGNAGDRPLSAGARAAGPVRPGDARVVGRAAAGGGRRAGRARRHSRHARRIVRRRAGRPVAPPCGLDVRRAGRSRGGARRRSAAADRVGGGWGAAACPGLHVGRQPGRHVGRRGGGGGGKPRVGPPRRPRAPHAGDQRGHAGGGAGPGPAAARRRVRQRLDGAAGAVRGAADRRCCRCSCC